MLQILGHNLTECATKEAQSNRMSIIGEGIEGLVTKTLHTRIYICIDRLQLFCYDILILLALD